MWPASEKLVHTIVFLLPQLFSRGKRQVSLIRYEIVVLTNVDPLPTRQVGSEWLGGTAAHFCSASGLFSESSWPFPEVFAAFLYGSQGLSVKLKDLVVSYTELGSYDGTIVQDKNIGILSTKVQVFQLFFFHKLVCILHSLITRPILSKKSIVQRQLFQDTLIPGSRNPDHQNNVRPRKRA